MADESLTVDEARTLLPAVAAELARRANADVMLIKGPSLEHHGLRSATAFADLDLICRPSHLASVLQELERSGWSRRESAALYDASSDHASTLSHSGWPLDIDVHSRFPGFGLEPAQAFELLWESRSSISTHAGPLSIPGESASALIMALHSIRGRGVSTRAQAEYTSIVARLRQDAVLRDAVATDIQRFGAGYTAREFCADVGIKRSGTEVPQSPGDRSWARRVAGGGTPTAYGLDIVLSARPSDRPGLVLRLLWPSAHDMRTNHPWIGPRRVHLARERLLRAIRGFRALPRAVWGAVQASKTRRVVPFED